MKYPLFIFIVLISSCIHKSVKPEEQIFTRNDVGLYPSSLLVDGCDTHFRFYETMGVAPSFYLPNEESKKYINEFIVSVQNKLPLEKHLYPIRVTLKFKKIGKSDFWLCSPNEYIKLYVIEVFEISKK